MNVWIRLFNIFLRINLPLSYGGLGISKTSLSSYAAFVSSIGSTWPLQQASIPRKGFLDSISKLSQSDIIVPDSVPHSSSILNLTPLLPNTQKKFMIGINDSIKDDLFENFSSRRKTIVTGRSCFGASYWLTSPPNWTDSSTIDAAPFRLLFKFSLGMRVIQNNRRCPDCDQLMDVYGDHAVTCKTATGVIDKHNSIV
jgi:hypothetical protein